MKLRHPPFANARLPHESERVLDDFVGDRHLTDERLQFENLIARQNRRRFVLDQCSGPTGDFHFLVEAWITHEHLEHEAVLLHFGQRIRAFLFDRVLRGKNKERRLQRMPNAAHGHLPFLHRFEQGRLRLRRSAVDFVRENDIREQWAAHEFEFAAPVERFSSITSVPVMSAGIKSGVN